MNTSRTIETAVGLFVIAGILAFAFLSLKVSNLMSFSDQSGYQVMGKFENVGGLQVRSPVAMAGVTIGRVTSIEFDQETFQAVVRMRIDGQYDQIPSDTSANIYTAGLLGEQYIELEAGGDIELLKNGDEFMLTQSALVLEELIGNFLVSTTSK